MFKAHKSAAGASHHGGGLLRIGRHLHAANQRLQSVVDQFQSIHADVKSIGSWLAPAIAYRHALVQLKQLGLSPAEMQQAKDAAWRNTQAIPTSTAAENLGDLAVLRQRLGNTAMALCLLPIVERTKALMAAAPEGGGQQIAARMAEAVNARAAAGTPAMAIQQANALQQILASPDSVRANGGAQTAKGGSALTCCDLPVLRQSAQNRNAAPRAMGAGAYPTWRQTDPMASQMALSAQWKNTQAMLGLPLVPVFQKIATVLSGLLASLSGWLQAHPRIAEVIAITLGGLSAALDIGGKILATITALRKLRSVLGSLSGDGARLGRWLTDIGARFGRWRQIAMKGGERLATGLRGKSGAAARWLGDAARGAARVSGRLLTGGGRWLGAVARRAAASSGAISRTVLRGGAALARSGAMRLVAGVASDVLLPVAAVAAAGYAGWKTGGWLNKHVINPGMKWLTNGKERNLGGWLYSLTHHEINPVAPTPKKTVQVNTTIHLDGRRIAEAVTRHQAQSANRPAASGRSFDMSLASPPIQMSYAR